MSIPGNANPLLLASAAAADTAANITKSLRFNSGDTATLSRTPSSAGNRKKWTWAGWIKRTELGRVQNIFRVVGALSDTTVFQIRFMANDAIGVVNYSYFPLISNAVFRDVGAWLHLVVSLDVDQSSNADKLRFYINGSEVTSWATDNRGSLGTNAQGVNQASVAHTIGGPGSSEYFSGYLADIYFIDGSALSPTSFGAYDDNGVWQAIGYSGTFGTNGFHLLDFANESTIGHDSSGNNNDFTANNLRSSNASGGAPTVTGTGPGFPAESTAIANLWDGAVSSYPGDFLTAADGGVITISWPTAIQSVTSIQYYSFNGSDRHNVNEGGWSGNSGSGAGYKTAYSGTAINLTKLQLQKNDQASFVKIGAIKINGTILTTSNYQSDSDTTDIYFDVPVNGDQSDTGAGGEVSGNYAIWNALGAGGSSTYGTMSNGNLRASLPASGKALAQTIFPQSGKWYCEIDFISGGGAGGGLRIGVINEKNIAIDLGSTANSWAYLADGRVYHNASAPSYGVSSSPGDKLMMALDIDAGKLWYGKNGTWMASGDPANGNNPSQTFTAGQKMSFSAQSGSGTVQVVDANWGQAAWTYTAPSGFKAVCTTNLPTPTIADGSEYFDAKLYSGNGGTNAITGFEFSPDFVWLKRRSSAKDHSLFDTVRGIHLQLFTNYNNAEASKTTSLTSFDSNGFTLGSSNRQNENGYTNVAWAWDAASSTASNTNGSITSSVRANQTAGFSIVGYTGSGSNATVGHGLNAALDFIIVKRRSAAGEWRCWHNALSNTQGIDLNSTGAAFTDDSFNDTIPTSSVFSLKGGVGNVNASSATYIAYCFTSVAGYSAFGSYEGNGSSTDGPFVQTNFRPSLIILKPSSGTGNWTLFDTTRDTFNVADSRLHANLNDAEATSNTIDILSNGFKIYRAGLTENSNGVTYIYVAFAENPFQANGGLAR